MHCFAPGATGKWVRRTRGRPVEASTRSTADHKIMCDFEDGCTSLNRRSVENGDAPFPAGREAVRMFSRGFPLFSSWLSAQIVLGNAAVRSEICGWFGGGSAGNSALLGKGRQLVHDMQIVQGRINTGDFASC